MRWHSSRRTRLIGPLAPVVVAAVLSGCAATIRVRDDPDRSLFRHAIFIRGDGGPANIRNHRGPVDFTDSAATPPAGSPAPGSDLEQVAGKYIDQPMSPSEKAVDLLWRPNYDFPAYLRQMMRGIDEASRSKRKLLIWIHGGRNLLGSSWKSTRRLVDATASSEYHVIAINWSSGDFPCYTGHLIYGRADTTLGPVQIAYRHVLKPPLVFAWDVGRAVSRIPVGCLQDIVREVMGFRESRAARDTVVDQLRFIRLASHERRGSLARATWGIATLPVRTVTQTLTNVFGPGEWETMRRRTETMFDPDAEFIPDHQPSPPGPSLGVLPRFIGELEKHAGPETPWEVTLIGHSMGTMIACEILKRDPRIRIRNVVFMAAACRVRDFTDIVLPYLERHPGTRFYNLMLHPANDFCETPIPVAGSLLYRGSLLAWLDDFLRFQVPSTERTFGREENALGAMRFAPESVRGRIELKTFPVSGLRGGRDADGRLVPTRHADFSNPLTRFWEPAFWSAPPKRAREYRAAE